MLTMHIENLDDLTVVECKGRIVRSDSVTKLRDLVTAQSSSVIVLDLFDVDAISGGALGMLVFLSRWAGQRNIRLKLFNPSRKVLEGLVNNRTILDFEIAGFHEMMRLVMESGRTRAVAA